MHNSIAEKRIKAKSYSCSYSSSCTTANSSASDTYHGILNTMRNCFTDVLTTMLKTEKGHGWMNKWRFLQDIFWFISLFRCVLSYIYVFLVLRCFMLYTIIKVINKEAPLTGFICLFFFSWVEESLCLSNTVFINAMALMGKWDKICGKRYYLLLDQLI